MANMLSVLDTTFPLEESCCYLNEGKYEQDGSDENITFINFKPDENGLNRLLRTCSGGVFLTGIYIDDESILKKSNIALGIVLLNYWQHL